MKRFLSWPGAKYRQLDLILNKFNDLNFSSICEPFWGTGAFTCTVGGKCSGNIFIADANKPLNNLWTWLFKAPKETIDLMAQYRLEWMKAETCQEAFNGMRDTLNMMSNESIEKAALLWVTIYHSINNLCHFNKAGEYNQSWGKGRKVPDPKIVFGVTELEAIGNVANKTGNYLYPDFRECLDAFMDQADGNSIAYLDPPYILGAKMYDSASWKQECVDDLIEKCCEMDNRGIPFIYTDYIEYGDTKHPYYDLINQRWKVFTIDRRCDAAPTQKGIIGHEVLIGGVYAKVEEKQLSLF